MSIQEELSAARMVPLRYLVSFNPRPTSNSGGDAVYLPMEAISEFGPPDTSRRRPFGDLRQGYSYVANGDVAFAKVTPCFENGKGLVARDLPDGQAFATTEVTVMRPSTEVDADYLGWILQSSPFLRQGESHMTGSGGLRRVPEAFVGSYSIPLPGRQVQRAIADYLDRETARIDTLIEEQQRLIEMLRERRQVLIEHLMLDSSDAPIRLSRIASSRSGDVPPPLEEGGQHMVWGAGRLIGYSSQANAQAGDLLVGRVGQGSVGKVRRLTENAWATDNTIVLRLDLSATDPRYIEHYLRLIPRFELVGGGAMPLVTAERLLAQSVPFTTLARQQEIADHLDDQTAKIDTLIAEAERFIELSRERRAALITAAVTGQVDVREMA